MSDPVNRIHATFSRQSHGGLWPFITAGYPDLAVTRQLLGELQAAGASGVEIGVPYSDPIADGPVIQNSYTRALEKGVKVHGIFEAVRAAREQDGVTIPLLAMVSDSIVFRYGMDRFAREACAVGIDGLIVPDLSLEEGAEVATTLTRAGVAYCPLVAPTTPPARAEAIAKLTTGFTYYMSVAGITGERRSLPATLGESVERLRKVSGKPVCVGFGISTAEQVQAVGKIADGVIVGSAIVRRITECLDRGAASAALVKAVGDFVRELGGKKVVERHA